MHLHAWQWTVNYAYIISQIVVCIIIFDAIPVGIKFTQVVKSNNFVHDKRP